MLESDNKKEGLAHACEGEFHGGNIPSPCPVAGEAAAAGRGADVFGALDMAN